MHPTEARISFPRLQVATAERDFLITDLSLSLGTYAVLREREIWLLGNLGITGFVCLSLSLLPWAANISFASLKGTGEAWGVLGSPCPESCTAEIREAGQPNLGALHTMSSTLACVYFA